VCVIRSVKKIRTERLLPDWVIVKLQFCKSGEFAEFLEAALRMAPYGWRRFMVIRFTRE